MTPDLNGTPLAALATFLDGDGWPLGTIDGHAALRTRYGGEHGVFDVVMWWAPEAERLLLYVVVLEGCAPHRRPDVAMVATRLNHGWPRGCWEVDLADGEVRLRVGLDADNALPVNVYEHLVRSCQTADAYSPAFVAVSQPDAPATPEAALAAVVDALA